MSPEEIKTLSHAFFDGKTLQYEEGDGDWCDWAEGYCPYFGTTAWRIKPDEPKRVKLEAWINENGLLMHKANFGEGYVARGSWIRIPELDREITLPERRIEMAPKTDVKKAMDWPQLHNAQMLSLQALDAIKESEGL